MSLQTPRLPRLLVTGANGFVLRQAVPIWRALGYAITVLDQHFDGDTLELWQVMKYPVTLIHAPVEHALANDLLPECDLLIHGAAITADPDSAGLTPAAHLQANLNPALMLLDWAADHNVSRTIIISSSAVYAKTSGIVSEDLPTTPQGTYAIAKAALEALTGTLKQGYQRDVLSIRLGNIYGIGETPSVTRPRISLIGRMLHEALSEGKVTVPPADQADGQAREWTFAPDIAYAIHALAQTPTLAHALYQVAAGECADRRTIAQAIQAALPNITIETDSSKDLNLNLRRGTLSHERLQADIRFSAWTPLQTGILRALETNQHDALLLR